VAAVVRRIYCVDTSSFLYCQRSFAQRSTRLTFFATVWTLLDRLADEERLLAPYLTCIEITRNKDEIGLWALAHLEVFRPKGEHAARVVEILKEPGQHLVDPTSQRGGEEADPWVIALAEAITATPPTLFDSRPVGIVISEETKAGGIAEICRRRSVSHLDFTEMLTAEGLSFGVPGTPI